MGFMVIFSRLKGISNVALLMSLIVHCIHHTKSQFMTYYPQIVIRKTKKWVKHPKYKNYAMARIFLF